MDAASTALAPSRASEGVPSRSRRAASITAWSAASRPRRSAAISPLTAATARDASAGVARAAVAPLMRLVAAGRGPGGHRRAGLRATGQRDHAGDGRRPARVERLEGQDALDRSIAHPHDATTAARSGVGIEQQLLPESARTPRRAGAEERRRRAAVGAREQHRTRMGGHREGGGTAMGAERRAYASVKPCTSSLHAGARAGRSSAVRSGNARKNARSKTGCP